MADKIDFDQSEDHIGGKFEWEREPACCDLLKIAVDEEHFVFVGNFVSREMGPK